MGKKEKNDIFVGLDIGTTKVVALVGVVDIEGKIDVVGIGSCPSRGLKKGIVINIDATVQSIKKAIEEAESMAGCEIHSVYTGISGSHIRSFNSHGIVAIRDREITQYDINRVIDAAKAVAIPADQKILHILPQEFIIDNQDGIKEPIGMSGVRLETKIHVVTGSMSAIQNIAKCIEYCGLHVNDIILQSLASSTVVLTEDEKELGVCLVDIGGGTTDIAIFVDGVICHSSVIPIAGDQVTNDIAIALRTPTTNAEEIKIKYANIADEIDYSIQIPSGTTHRPLREIPHKYLIDIVGARYEELFTLIQNELDNNKYKHLLGAGMVLTGGASNINGVLELAEKVFQIPVRGGVAQKINGMSEIANNPIYATGAGLLLTGFQQCLQGKSANSFFGESKNMWNKIKKWVQTNF